ncbi:MAG: DUF72 domain-containing protein [Saprospiraceae bacterium]|nr:DUF72 domain-containing protein [Saprospiraceae bacterium]
MEFGKIHDIDQVDFRLPHEPARNADYWSRRGHAPGPSLRIYIGATGYHMKPWVGSWYPEGTKPADYLFQYGKQFNTIEHNSTHYRLPDAAAVARWREETQPDFRFCPKVLQSISHAPDLGASSTLIESFADALSGLEEKYGCAFLQLPPSFSPHQWIRLERFLLRWPAQLPLAVEVRHPEFFPESPLLFDLLEKHGVAAVITDVAGRRDVCHMHVTAPRTLVRFVGNGLHETDYSRIDEWGARLAAWSANGLQEIYFFTHEPDNLLAPELAAYAAKTFRRHMPHAHLRGPEKRAPDGLQGRLF